eukprot:c8448_g1_i1.p1 GENE.c8448_g1_i1~~c8448_g1_i1.p1  ORF type:complete len:350 (-),score=31.54 c8448_g1_i1:183-1232(-)
MGNHSMRNRQPASRDLTVFSSGQRKPGHLEDFMWKLTEEPHFSRRKEILAKFPQIRELMGYEWRSKYIVLAILAVQFTCAYLLRDMAFTWQFFVTAYVVGATLTQAQFLAIHEMSHFLFFQSFKLNKLFGLLANTIIVFPYTLSFRAYHMDHHKYQGVEGVDTDLPTKIEAKLLSSFWGKLFFLTNQIFFYALRPCIVRRQVFTLWHLANLITCLAFDAAVVYFFGLGPIWYFLMSTYLAGSIHPCASHFVAEHYVFVEGVETYSYYGPLNRLCFNVGYHNEHHDFPNIPWSRLPDVRRIASEYYDNIPQHKSWPLVLWKFLTDPNVGCYNRVKRLDKVGSLKRPAGMH